MIDIRELRIGNLLIQGGVIGIETDLIDGDNGVYCGMGSFYNTETIEPIPITSELLIKLGFIKKYNEDDFDFWGKGDFDEYFLWEHDKGYCYNFGKGYEIKYIHQLQNLYFSLTGEELTKEYI